MGIVVLARLGLDGCCVALQDSMHDTHTHLLISLLKVAEMADRIPALRFLNLGHSMEQVRRGGRLPTYTCACWMDE